MTVKVSNYGGVVQSIWAPDRTGQVDNVALGFASLDEYVADFARDDATYFGAIVGRYANRIGGGEFSLDGVVHRLPQNNGPNTLHGGPDAYSTQVWEASIDEGASLKLTYIDPDGKNGFPGNVANTVTYTLTADNALRIDYHASTDAPTVVNLTNHTYFNLGGAGSGDVFGHRVRLEAEHYTPVDANLIPSGTFAAVPDTPFDFREAKPIGQDIRVADEQLMRSHGYDHNFVLTGSGLRLAATVLDPFSGRVLRTHTTEPGLQLYTGNFLVGDRAGASGHIYRQGDGFALETQHYPDTPHHLDEPGWPSVVLKPGQTFTSTTIHHFGVAEGS